MTRINVVTPSSLADSHLLIEYREITRIPNAIAKGKAIISLQDLPTSYRLGTGHVKFFYNKLLFLYKRYDALLQEIDNRDFSVTTTWAESGQDRFPAIDSFDPSLLNDYAPTSQAIQENINRLCLRMPKNAKYYRKPLSQDQYSMLLYVLNTELRPGATS